MPYGGVEAEYSGVEASGGSVEAAWGCVTAAWALVQRGGGVAAEYRGVGAAYAWARGSKICVHVSVFRNMWTSTKLTSAHNVFCRVATNLKTQSQSEKPNWARH